MWYRKRCGKVNVKLVIVLILVTAAVGVSLVVARQTRRNVLSEKALTAGQAAFEKQDWPAAVKSFREYLSRNPGDVEVLRKYAQACLSIRPLDAAAVGGAISAYRRIVELAPGDDVAQEKLAMLYGGVGNFDELASIARARLERDPNDLRGPLWLAEALARTNKTAQAQQILTAFLEKLEALGGKHVEYVRACVQMSHLAANEAGAGPQATADHADANTPPTPQEWLDRAVAYSPDSVEALVSRAQFQRRMAELSSTSEQDRPSLLALARKDLEAIDAKGTSNMQIRFVLAAEWMAHGELDQAAAELAAADKLAQEKLQESFFDIDSWTTARFLLASELAARRGAAAEAAALADETLKSLTEKGHRARVLPSAIPLYVAAGRVAEARGALDEYLGLVRAQEAPAESPRRLAGLQALVAGAENRPYAVIDALAPVIGNEPSGSGLWRLLAEAYDRTGQAGRAVKALVQYRRLNPQDPQALRELARQYAKVGNWQKAFDTATTAQSLGSTDLVLKLLRLGAGINLAVEQRDSGNADELGKLSAELADLRRAYPDQVDIRTLQAIIADSLGRPEEAERELQLAVEQCKEPLKAQIQLAGHYLRAKRVKEAIGVCVAACQSDGAAAEPWLALADVHTANADYDAARSCLKQGLDGVAAAGEKRSLSMKLALLEIVHGDRATGIRLLRELAAQDAQEIQARSLLLGVREIQQDPAAAQALVQELRQAEGESGLWWRLHQASLWLSSDDWSSKRPEITNLLGYCVSADPAWSAPVLLLAGMYEKSGDFRRLEDVCRQGLLGNPAAADIAGRLLTLLERQGRFADAEKLLQQIEINPRVASAWQIRMALGAKDLPRAIDELKLRVSNDEQDASARIQLARLVYEQTKNAEQALEYLKQAEAVAAESRTLVAVKASILRGEGQTAEALHVLDDYVAAHNDFDAYWMRAVYLAEQGERDRAEQDYRKLTTFPQNGAVAFELLGNFYSGTGKLDQGIAALEEGLRAYPQDLRLQRRWMQLLFLRGQPPDRERALGILAALEEQRPQDVELITVRAAQMLREPIPPSFETIKRKLENVVKMEPTAVNAHLVLIAIAMQQEDYQAACDYAVRALDANPQNPALLSARGRAELALDCAPMAVRLVREALRADPNSTEALGVFADGALSGNDRSLLEEARTLVSSALGRSPANERLLILQSHVLAALETPAAAIPSLEAYCQSKEGGGGITALVTLADLYRLAGDAEQSRQWLARAEQSDARNQAVVHARFLWLVSQRRWGDLQQISSEYISATGQNPATVLRAASMLLTLDPMELKKEAVKLFEHAVTLTPTSLDARRGLALSLYQTGDVEAAEKVYRQLLAQRPDDVRVLNDLAWVLQEHGRRYDEALELANRGLRLARDTPDILHLLDTRGTILSNLPDRLADAKSDFEKIVELSSDDAGRQAKALWQLGRLCVKLDEPAQARRYLESALEIDRKNNVFTPDERREVAEIIQTQ
jgi:tetratricopeptide (TPR) repeat protein